MNEQTMIEKGSVVGGQHEEKNGSNAWKHVTLGGVSGIMMGAGLLYAGQTVASTTSEPNEKDAEDTPAEEHVSEASLPVAQLHNNLSFGEAFAAARAEVGPGGVFIWHGGIYNTYTAEEWETMTPAQKSDFAQLVNPEISAHDIATPTDAHPDVAVQHSYGAPADDVHIVNRNAAATDDDVHIVGYANVDGHLAVSLDVTGDGQADVAIIDVDDNRELSAPDLVIDREGNHATVGEIIGEHDSNMEAYNDSSGMADGMQADSDCLVMEI